MGMTLENFDYAAFVRDSWQRHPLLIRNPWRGWVNPLEPDELAGMACEQGIESRLVTGAAGAWALEHGPIAEARFAQLGERGWTLLVQAADHHVPAVAALIEPFRFIPNWRIDDVMVSYAADGGGVGPHFDQYDVFLVQGLGRRRWRIGARCDETTPLLGHHDLRLLADFEVTQEWVLDPGDILYLPPGVAHDGVALGSDCMTYSIGFRAPSRRELIALWSDEALADLGDDDRYADNDLPRGDNPGEISGDALARLQGMIAETLLDRDGFARWFGCYSSARKDPDADWRPGKAMTRKALFAAIARGTAIERNPASRFAFVEQTGEGVLLFVDGACYECSARTADFARALCAQTRVATDPGLSGFEPVIALITQLCNHGSVAFATG